MAASQGIRIEGEGSSPVFIGILKWTYAAHTQGYGLCFGVVCSPFVWL